MVKEIWFDMDGTIADLYSVEGWRVALDNEETEPYENAKVLVNMNALAKVLNRLIKKGCKVGVISWTARHGSPKYNARVAEVKKNWLKKHLASVDFSEIHIVDYGTPKEIFAKNPNSVLFDDNEKIRKNWKGIAFDENNIVENLKILAKGA